MQITSLESNSKNKMADDRDVLRAVWDGRVPAAFTLSPFEVETLTAPPPFYLMLPRQSYITVCTDKVYICCVRASWVHESGDSLIVPLLEQATHIVF